MITVNLGQKIIILSGFRGGKRLIDEAILHAGRGSGKPTISLGKILNDKR